MVETEIFGIARDGSVELAKKTAIEHAIKLSGVAGAVWPWNSQPMFTRVSEVLISELIAFSIHARRVLEIEDQRDTKIEGSRWQLEDGSRDCEYETNLWDAINRVIHARNIEVLTFKNGSDVFEKMEDRVVAHVKVTSDKGSPILICPTALVIAYLQAGIEKK